MKLAMKIGTLNSCGRVPVIREFEPMNPMGPRMQLPTADSETLQAREVVLGYPGILQVWSPRSLETDPKKSKKVGKGWGHGTNTLHDFWKIADVQVWLIIGQCPAAVSAFLLCKVVFSATKLHLGEGPENIQATKLQFDGQIPCSPKKPSN